MRKREIVDRSTHSVDRAAGTAAFLPASRGRGVHEETGDELSLLCKHLNSVAATLADVNQVVHRDMHAVERGSKLLLIRRRTRFPVIGRRRIIVDLAQRYAVSSPATLEGPGVHVVYDDALGVHDIDLVSGLV